MAQNLVQKIISAHHVAGEMTPGSEMGIRIDQTLTQDATGTTADLQFEAMDIPRVRTKLSVSYVDHNMLQVGFENADDHRFLQTFAAKYGALLLPARQRHLPPGAPGALQRARRHAAGLRQPHAHLRRRRHAGHRRRRPRCRRGHGRRAVLHR